MGLICGTPFYHIIDHEYRCQKCRNLYVPLDANYPCPSCKKLNNNIDDAHFLEYILWMMQKNKDDYGKFTPDILNGNGLGRSIERFVYSIFDKIENGELMYGVDVFDKDIQNYFGENREHTWQNVKDVIASVHASYVTGFEFKKSKVTIGQRWRKFRKFWKNLVP